MDQSREESGKFSIYIPPIDTNLGLDEHKTKIRSDEPRTPPNSASSTEKKGFFNSFFSSFKRKTSINKTDESSNSNATSKTDTLAEKSTKLVVKKTFAQVAREMVSSIREKKKDSKKVKLESIVDMLMARKAYYMSLISKSEETKTDFKKSSIKTSQSYPSGLNHVHRDDASNLKQQSNLSCSYSENICSKDVDDKKPRTPPVLSSESSFESTGGSSADLTKERPLIRGRYMKNTQKMSGNCNKAIVRASVKRAFMSKEMKRPKSYDSHAMTKLGKNSNFRKTMILGREALDYRNLVKMKLRNKCDQIYLCAFQVVLHPESFEPVIIWLNPEYTDIDDLYNYRDFCFPELKSTYKNYKYKETDLKTYQFVRTKIDGTKEYGYCRKYVHPKSDKKELPVVFCLVSKVDAFTMYDQILEELGQHYYKQDIEMVHLFLICLYTKPLPSPDGPASYMKLSHDRYLVLQRNSDYRLTNSNCDILLRFLGIENIIKIITAILSERSVFIFSHRLSLLSRVMDAIRSLTYPFVWPYSYVPVLPSHLVDHCESPCPYLLGAISDNFEDVMKRNLTDVVIVHLNRNKIYNYNQDEMNTLPEDLTKTLIKLCNRVKVLFKSDKFLEMTIAEGFLQLFVELFHNYTDFITSDNGFKQEEFIMSNEDLNYRSFLARFCETCIFQHFIINFVEKPSSKKTFFEERVVEYKEEDRGRSKAKKKATN